MKIVFSRKGFDSSAGKVASPILPSGRLCPLPIPETLAGDGALRYRDILYDGQSLGTLVHDLTHGTIAPDVPAHLDPDLNTASIPRLPGWKAIFGQAGAAERHLQNQGVGSGDVFLFYGWFRRVECCAGTYRYVQGALDLHVIFGWLQIEQRIPVAQRSRIPSWAGDHAHCRRAQPLALDSLYIATSCLTLPGITLDKPGAGLFPQYHPLLCLTNQEPHVSRRIWRLPHWMSPAHGRSALTYRPDLKRWETPSDHVLLKSAGRGQEFVLDCAEYPEAVAWLANLIQS
jgi:Nucleotide modification associated domain 3